MKKYTITAVALSTGLTACADPIIGEWDGKTATSTADGNSTVSLPYESCYEVYDYNSESGEETATEYCNTMEFSLSIDADLTGTMQMAVPTGSVSPTLAIVKSGNNAYKITATVEDESLDLNCTLSDAQNLNCVFPLFEFHVDFEKQN